MTQEVYSKAFEIAEQIKLQKRNISMIDSALNDEAKVSNNGTYNGKYAEIGKFSFMMNEIYVSPNNIKAILNGIKNLEFNNICDLENQFNNL